MKTTKLIFPLTLALVAILATTGCKKGLTKVTQLPGQPAQVGNGGDISGTLPQGQPMTQDLGNVTPGGGPGQLPVSSSWDPTNMIQDREALAAYTVHFAFDSSTVKSDEESKVTIVSEALKSDNNAKLLIEGNCDERGTEEYNRSLGERRALALRELLAKDGVDPDRIRTISYGKDKPVDPGHDESAFAKNRRGDFVLCHPKTAQ
jgi:peptidoglycan-associated lipoprotein